MPALALALASLALGVAPAAAQGGCGGVQTAQPSVHRGAGPPPLAIGDSTMLLALPYLAREGFAVNAHGCREYDEALALLRGLSAARRLPQVVVVALGADGTVTNSDVAQTLSILGPTRLLVLVTPRELGGGSGSDAATIRAEGRAHPGRIQVLDWVAYASGHGGDWFQPDGLHLTFTGAAVFARFLRAALDAALPSQSLTISGRERPAGPGAPVAVSSFRTRLKVPSGWTMSGRHVHAGVPDVDLVSAGPCAYHLRVLVSVSWTAPPAAPGDHLRTLIPPGVAPAAIVRGPGRGAVTEPAMWTAWRGPGAVGGDWSKELTRPETSAGRADGRAFLDVSVVTARGGHCRLAVARRVQGQVLGMLASLRAFA